MMTKGWGGFHYTVGRSSNGHFIPAPLLQRPLGHRDWPADADVQRSHWRRHVAVAVAGLPVLRVGRLRRFSKGEEEQCRGGVDQG